MACSNMRHCNRCNFMHCANHDDDHWCETVDEETLRYEALRVERHSHARAATLTWILIAKHYSHLPAEMIHHIARLVYFDDEPYWKIYGKLVYRMNPDMFHPLDIKWHWTRQ